MEGNSQEEEIQKKDSADFATIVDLTENTPMRLDVFIENQDGHYNKGLRTFFNKLQAAAQSMFFGKEVTQAYVERVESEVRGMLERAGSIDSMFADGAVLSDDQKAQITAIKAGIIRDIGFLQPGDDDWNVRS